MSGPQQLAGLREEIRLAVENYCSHPDGAGECACDLIMAGVDAAFLKLSTAQPASLDAVDPHADSTGPPSTRVKD